MPDIFDTHAHLNDRRMKDDVDGVLSRARASGVTRVICSGYDIESSRLAVEIAERHDNVWATVGVHPHDAQTLTDSMLAEITELAARPKVVAIGEIGLDYHYDRSPREIQAEALRRQLKLAQTLGMPVVIHERESGDDAYNIIAENLPKAGGVFHCFSGDTAHAARVMGLGFYLGISGTVTFKNAQALREVVETAPIERLLIETDCPYLTPEPFRGRRQNEPELVRLVAQKVAEIRGTEPDEVARATTENALRLYTRIGSAG